MGEYVVHMNPVWRSRANFIIQVKIDSNSPTRWEQLWSRQVSKVRFIICCIPMFAHDLSLGDEVETESVEGKDYVVRRVVNPSDRFVFRVWFGESTVPDARSVVPDELKKLGALVEWYSSNLMAVDATPDIAQTVADYLASKESTGALVYETGRTK